jgi:hypothetical protein
MSEMSERPNRDPPIWLAWVDVDQRGRAVALPITDRITEEAGRNIGKIIRPVVMPIVAIRTAISG